MQQLPPLNLPPYPFQLKEEGGKLYIFDEIRRKNLVLTPEEWVRQHFIQYLINQKNYPKGLINIEGGLKVHELNKRSDILLFNTNAEKQLLVECKASSVKLTQKAFDQLARYNTTHKAKIIILTNGLEHYCCEVDHELKSYKFLAEVPVYIPQ
ncbi:type I restriction enzyme HsdR N-terminal domain-containing protein [Solitalea sp. MAHUQ-68]|uniref:Type I restriction enzyme HsdR N-terminal domain-containing protein n=1 Tax=Solitalea agri TaxID=2953739 RepID=A0A9X2F7N9_9SPHI|nr:type I restriction enzyme HsdR N-terminal domain-containing protein [Solitalea agri]MCO4292183.1 type I restriction enzyme HsdR N-terminal domain-containing protein [Solitalea agri]